MTEGETVRLEELLAMVLDIAPAELDETTSQASLDRWDSLAHLAIISAVEENFGVLFTAAEMRGATSLAELRRLLADKGVAT